MRFNTKLKRKAYREEMIRLLHSYGYMYNNSAEDVADKWIEKGLRGFTGKIVAEHVKLAMFNVVYRRSKSGKNLR